MTTTSTLVDLSAEELASVVGGYEDAVYTDSGDGGTTTTTDGSLEKRWTATTRISTGGYVWDPYYGWVWVP